MSKIIAIASGKGGTGKTSISVNLATLLAEREMESFSRVSLTDLDVEEPNATLFFRDLKPMVQEVEYRLVPEWNETLCSFCGKCSDICQFNSIAFLGNKVLVFPDLCHSCHACSELCPENALPMRKKRMGEYSFYNPTQSNLILSEYRLDVGQPSAVPLISSAIDRLRSIPEEHQLFLLDAPPGTSCPMMEVTKAADYVILVTEPTPFGLHDLDLAVKTVKILGKDCGVILNKAGSGNDSIITDYCISNKVDFIGKIPQSRKIAEAYSRGNLVYDINREIRESWDMLAVELLKRIDG